jgi:hypothetical protein
VLLRQLVSSSQGRRSGADNHGLENRSFHVFVGVNRDPCSNTPTLH